jgi:hypothetical protein
MNSIWKWTSRFTIWLGYQKNVISEMMFLPAMVEKVNNRDLHKIKLLFEGRIFQTKSSYFLDFSPN